MSVETESQLPTNDYRCDVCEFVYRSAENEGVDLIDQPDEFVCPNCQATKSHFQVYPGVDDPTEDDATGDVDDDEEPEIESSTEKPRNVYTDAQTPTVASLKGLQDDGDLDVRPPYQRFDVWTNSKKSKLIESVFLGLPLPRLYLAENPDGTQEVIDGQQRLLALFQFMDEKYKLTGLKTLGEHNGSSWSTLSKEEKRHIRNTTLSTVLIQKESDPELRYDLFERLNTGATGLNEQELRNAVYRGEYNDFIARLATSEDWKLLHNLPPDGHKRMADREWVLRFMAFRDQTYLHFPDKKLTKFLNRQMESNQPNVSVDLDKAETDFKQAVALCRTVFGNHAFKRFQAGNPTSPDGQWESKRTLALEDVQLWGMTRFDKGQIVGHADAIRDASIVLSNDPEFERLIVENTSGKAGVERRFEMWKAMLDDVLADSQQGPRAFPHEIKQELWNESKTCARCGQQILLFDDAHVDHKAPYSQGGKTEKANGQLMHRYCNLAKGASS